MAAIRRFSVERAMVLLIPLSLSRISSRNGLAQAAIAVIEARMQYRSLVLVPPTYMTQGPHMAVAADSQPHVQHFGLRQ